MDGQPPSPGWSPTIPRMVTNHPKSTIRKCTTGCIKKNAPLCFLYISAAIKGKEIVFIWEDRGDLSVRFEYKTNSERYMVAEILAKRFGASIS